MAKIVSWVLGVVLVIAGIWGFFAQPAVGFIAGNTLGNIIHLVVGIVLLVMAGKPSAAMTLKVVGIVYVVWGLIGLFGWGFTAENRVTSWFYLVVGIVVAALAWMNKGGASAPAAPMTPPSQPQM